jgi:MFS family permease
MAPFFGSSTVIWANTIAVVLLALSAGYKLGGVLADRHPHARTLYSLVLVGSALLAIVPFIAHPFLSLSVRAFDTLSVGAFTASLFGTLVLVAVPLLLLGAVSPWAMRLRLATVEEAGATGRAAVRGVDDRLARRSVLRRGGRSRRSGRSARSSCSARCPRSSPACGSAGAT